MKKKLIGIACWSMLIALFITHAQAKGAPGSFSDGYVLTMWGPWQEDQGLEAVILARENGARHISFLAQLCQDNRTSVEMRWCFEESGTNFEDSLQGQRLKAILRYLKEHSMTFNLIPFPMLGDKTSRSYLEPENSDEWFKNYEQKVQELAHFSSKWKADELIVASELTSLFELENKWRDLIAKVRGIFKGHLTITTIAAFYSDVKFWDALDSIGVSAYFPLTILPWPNSVSQLEVGWKLHKEHLLAYAKKLNKPLTFVEMGYPATNVAAMIPWDYQWDKRQLDLNLQSRCFEAFKNVWAKEKQLRRFQIWGLNDKELEPKAFNPIGKPAGNVVKEIFSIRSSL